MPDDPALRLGGADRQLVDLPAVGVILEARREHERLSRLREDLVSVEGLVPQIEVLDRGEEGARREWQRHVEVVGVTHAGERALVTMRPLFDHGVPEVVPRAAHPERVEDPLLHDLGVGLRRDLLDDRAEQEIRRVVVLGLRSRLELQVAAAILQDEVLDPVGIPAHVLEEAGKPRVAGDARRVVEQLVDRDLGARVLAVVGQGVGEGGVELQLAVPDELQHDRRGELLRDRGEAELRVGRVRDLPLEVREAEALLEDHLPVLGDEGRAVERADLLVPLQEGVDGGRLVVGEEADGGEDERRDRRAGRLQRRPLVATR